MRLLDLYCGAGGSAVGYHRAGFTEIVGVDSEEQPRYPFEFVRSDALEYLAARGTEFDAVHASPPCQAYTAIRSMHKGRSYPDLVLATRRLLNDSGKTYVIENVPGTPLVGAVVLCGSMFGLGAHCSDGHWRELRRHRLFECNVRLKAPACNHCGQPVGVYGNGGGNKARVFAGLVNGLTGTAAERKEAMGIDWMTQAELSQAIPPSYTEFVGKQLLEHLGSR